MVAVRVRPLSRAEQAQQSACAARCERETLLMQRVHDDKPQQFNFDYVYGPEVHNVTLFDDLGTEVLGNAWLGYNASVFAYGQVSGGGSVVCEYRKLLGATGMLWLGQQRAQVFEIR